MSQLGQPVRSVPSEAVQGGRGRRAEVAGGGDLADERHEMLEHHDRASGFAQVRHASWSL